jgi:hypothetical protein
LRFRIICGLLFLLPLWWLSGLLLHKLHDGSCVDKHGLPCTGQAMLLLFAICWIFRLTMTSVIVWRILHPSHRDQGASQPD